MPYSYMSFVIKNAIEQEQVDNQKKIFDQEAFNYIFFKGTSFLDGEFVYADHNQLK